MGGEKYLKINKLKKLQLDLNYILHFNIFIIFYLIILAIRKKKIIFLYIQNNRTKILILI